MMKILYTIGWLLVLSFCFVFGLLLYGQTDYYKSRHPEPAPIVVQQTPVEVPDPNIKKFRVGSNSMCFMGYCKGDIVSYRVQDTCEVGDVCSFTCLSDKCVSKGKDIFHLVEKKTEKGYYLVGDPKKAPCSEEDGHIGGLCKTLDSRVYGFIKEPDIKINGVIIPK